MKKFASVLLAVLVAFSMFSFVVSAANPTLTVSADKTTVKAGDVVTVAVKLSEESGLGALTIDVVYDATAFKAVEMTDGGKEEGLGAVVNANYAEGKARATLAIATTVEKAGTVCTLKLEALKAADSTIAISVAEACDADFNPVEVASNTVAIKGVEEPTTDEPTTDEPTTDEPTTDEPSTDCTEHKWSTWAVTDKPTCSAAGVESRNCTICGETEKRALEKDADAHNSGKWVVTKKATATAEGEKVRKCTLCDTVLETAKIAKLSSDELKEPAIPNTDAIA